MAARVWTGAVLHRRQDLVDAGGEQRRGLLHLDGQEAVRHRRRDRRVALAEAVPGEGRHRLDPCGRERHGLRRRLGQTSTPSTPRPVRSAGRSRRTTGSGIGRRQRADTVYFGSLGGKVYALDAASGGSRWEQPFQASSVVRGGPALVGTTLVVADDEGVLYGLDAGTGQPDVVARRGSRHPVGPRSGQGRGVLQHEERRRTERRPQPAGRSRT